MIFRRTIVGALATIWATASLAGPQHILHAERPQPRGKTVIASPQDRLAGLIAKSRVSGESSAVLIDVASGRVLETYQGNKPMPPASVTKVATTLFAISNLGANFRFTTRVLATGPVRGGKVQGDLVLVGGGDPALDSDEMASMVKSLRDKGIKGVTGKFLYYANVLPKLREIDAGQPANAGYNPGLSGLNLNFNRVYFEWKPKDGRMTLSLQARAEAHSPHVRGMSVVAANRSAPVYMYSEKGGADHWSIAAGALKKPGGVWLPVRAPATYGAEVFRTLAHHYGVQLPPAREVARLPQGTEVARYTRRELKLVSRGMLHFSNNMTAEALGLTASRQRSLAASARAMSVWLQKNYGATTASFRDHSGLGETNRISANDMARMVADAGRRGQLEGLLRKHFVARPGSKQPVSNKVEVRAKTGTLNFVRGLSGIIHGANGRKLAFAIFSADLPARARADHSVSRPVGTKTFSTRARALEQAILADWIAKYAL